MIQWLLMNFFLVFLFLIKCPRAQLKTVYTSSKFYNLHNLELLGLIINDHKEMN